MESKIPLGPSPAVLANRDVVKPDLWCSKPDLEFDYFCDPKNPKTILHTDVIKAAAAIKNDIPKTPLVKSLNSKKFGLDLYFKYEIFHKTGSFSERGALYSLKRLSDEQRKVGVITASLGNWAMALAYHGQKLNVPVTVIFPIHTMISIVDKCQDFGATVILFGTNLAEAKRQAFVRIAEKGGIYINGYDYPDAIAGAGTIGLEILQQLPQTEAILIPVGGGGLIAGISTVVKHFKPDIKIYGIEPNKSPCFYEAMQSERPCHTAVSRSIAETLAVSTAGFNAFHTAQSLLDKMILVDDDCIAQAMLHLIEDEKYAVDGAGAVSLSALLATPDKLPELRGEKKVVCLITGGNINQMTLPKCLARAKAAEGRLIKLTITLPADGIKEQRRALSMVANVGCNILDCYIARAWATDDDFFTIYLTLVIETRGMEHTCMLKRVMERLFPNLCDFLEEPFCPLPICACYPKRFA